MNINHSGMLMIFVCIFVAVTWFEQSTSPPATKTATTTKEIEIESEKAKGKRESNETSATTTTRNVVKGKSYCEKAQVYASVWVTGALFIHSYKQTNKTDELCVRNLYGDCQCYLNQNITKKQQKRNTDFKNRSKWTSWLELASSKPENEWVNECTLCSSVVVMYVCIC